MALLKSSQFRKFPLFYNTIQSCNYAKYFADKEIKKSYNILGIPEDSDQAKIRSAYLELVKRFHPDCGGAEADSNKFQEIDKAFRILLNKKSKERWGADEVDFEIHAKEYDIKHTAPQHRQYLNFEGIGIGTPYQREKQYSKIRAMHAAESVLNHRMQKAQADEKTLMEKKPHTHKIKTKYGFDRLVEDLIQEAMSRGEFDNLSGKGKPLTGNQNMNPYVDFVTHKLNQVLIENGFTPEWIMLQKEIREDKNTFQKNIYNDRAQLGKYPFEQKDIWKWETMLENWQKQVDSINKKIAKYNLVVPILQKQMFLVDLAKEADKVAQYGQTKYDVEAVQSPKKNEARDNPKNIFSFIESFFVKS